MLALVLTLALTTLNAAFAKTDWCKFDSDFSAAYVQARKNYANHLRHQRETADGSREIRSGVSRRRLYGHLWQRAPLKQTIKDLFGDQEVVFSPQTNGKILIHSKNLQEKTVIVFDSSGDYFRIMKAKMKNNGKIKSEYIYYDLTGKAPLQPKGVSVEEWQNMVEYTTHFHAVP